MKSSIWQTWQDLFRRHAAWVTLSVASLWVVFPWLIYGLIWESHSYHWDMLPGAFILLAALCALGWVHPALFFVGALPLTVLNIIYAHTAHVWWIGGLAFRVETALDSSPEETREFFQQYVFHNKFTLLLVVYFLGMVALGAAYWYFFRRGSRRWDGWKRWGVGLGITVVLLAGGWHFLETYPATNLGITTYKVYTRINPILARKENVAAFLAQEPPPHCNAPYDKIVFVLGESANRDYMSAYGFEMPTTPFLEALPNKVLARAISPVNQTMTAVPLILTPATIADYDLFYTRPSVISDLRRCGYQTVWLSNQLRYSPYTSTVSSIASEADIVKFADETLHLTRSAPDGVLFQLFSPDDLVPGKKQAYFFHLIGSHFDWKERYPPESALIPNPANIEEEYINTIHYTDQVLEQIFRTFQSHSEHMLFIYVSDHSEWVTPEQAGHAHAHPFQDEYRIPLVFWSTHPEDLQAIAEATANGRLVNTETLDLQIRYLLGLETSPGISYNTHVFGLGPGRLYDYYELPAQDKPEQP